MQVVLPIRWYPPRRARNRLIFGMAFRCCEFGAVDVSLPLVVPKPSLTWLKALDHGVTNAVCVPCCVLGGRAVAASNVTTLRTAPEVKPPTFIA